MDRPLTWPEPPPSSGDIMLRRFTPEDIPMVRDLATDPYVPQIGTLPAGADEAQAMDYIERQWARLSSGRGFSFCVAWEPTGTALGQAGLWRRGPGVASAGYAIAPRSRGHGHAGLTLKALAGFGLALSGVRRIELHIEPWNTPSARTAEAAGFRDEGAVLHPRSVGAAPVEMLLYAAGS